MRRVVGPAAGNARCDDLECLLDLRANDPLDMKITDPHAFERSYTLEAKDGEHRPGLIAVLLGRLLPSRPNNLIRFPPILHIEFRLEHAVRGMAVRIDGTVYEHDAVIDRGEVRFQSGSSIWVSVFPV